MISIKTLDIGGWQWLPLSSHGIAQDILVGKTNAIFQLRPVRPAKGSGFAHIQQLTRGAVKTGGVSLDATRIKATFVI